MTWDAHQGRGGFGFSPPGKGQNAWQFGRWGVARIEEAIAETEEVRAAFWAWMRWPDAPPYAGGVLTDWPARESAALAFAKREWAVVQAYLKSLEA